MNKVIKFIKDNYIMTILTLLIVGLFIIMTILFIKRGTFSFDNATSVEIECPDVTTVTNEMECNINLHVVGDKISGINANYSLPSNIEYVSFIGNDTCDGINCLEVLETTNNGFVLVNTLGVSGDSSLGRLKVKFLNNPAVNEEYNISLINIEASDINDVLIPISNTTSHIKVADINNKIIIDNEKMIISRIPLGITYDDLLSRIYMSGTTTIKSKNGTELSRSDKVKTMDTITFTKDESIQIYKISVLGDVSGDGEVLINDVDMIYRNMKGKLQLEDAKLLAGDISKDNKILINDVDYLYRYLKHKISSLEVTK